jgi:DNA polymerase III sliding clamp (beta) subunit (PCNA family)
MTATAAAANVSALSSSESVTPATTDFPFRARTSDAFSLKLLSELLSRCVQSFPMALDVDGIGIVCGSIEAGFIIQVNLNKEGFNQYHCDKQVFVGLSTDDFSFSVKHIKRSDSVCMYLSKDLQHIGWNIEFVSDHMRNGEIRVKYMSFVQYELPRSYDEIVGICIPSIAFQRMTKEFQGMQQNILIRGNSNWILFKSQEHIVRSNSHLFGEFSEESVSTYEFEIPSINLLRINKISSMHRTIIIKVGKDHPLQISARVGNLGWIRVHLLAVKSTSSRSYTTGE